MQPMLGHEFGTGAPCMQCSNCAGGLDLHFWRKMCKACGCRLDQHDVMRQDADDHGNLLAG